MKAGASMLSGRPLWLLLIMLVVGISTAEAQRAISGKVTDASSGEGLIGADVLIKGTSTGTATDFEGNYALNANDGDTLVFSYVGYQSVAIIVAGQSTIDVSLQSGEYLDEVVVIGYGTTRKADATGAVNAVDEESFNQGAIVSPDQLIVGKVAGVSVQLNSGEPGAQAKVRIRGSSSVNASNEPLYVIDGVPIDNEPHNPGGFSGGRNPLNFLNPNDIESFTVLKDASATAIYGSRGANGVIIITTKKGKDERGKVSYNGYVSTGSLTGDPDNFSAEDFRNLVTFAAPGRLEILGNNNTNWFNELTRDAKGQSHSLSFAGGSDKVGVRASFGYFDQEGIVLSSRTQRTTVGLNYTQSMFDDQFNINANYKGAFTKDDFNGAISNAWEFDPTQPVYDEANTDFGGFFEYGQALTPRNPVSEALQVEDEGKYFRNLGNVEFEYKPNFFPGFSAKLNLGIDLNTGERQRFQPTTYLRQPVSSITGEINHENVTRNSELLESYFTYDRSLNGGMHRITATAGYSYQDFRGEFPRWRAWDLSSDIFGANSAAPASEFIAANSVIENRLISFFGRVNYALKDRYLFTGTIRRDGSTRFSESNRWGWFPSFAVGWRITEEEWAEGISNTFSDLKLRVGYGVTGNQEISDYAYLPTYTFGDAQARYQFGNAFVNTVRANGYDSNLKWEETSSLNVGLDWGFNNGRINGSIEYYQKNTSDMLFEVFVPAGTNLTDRVLTNIGKMENSGVELTVNAVVLDKPDARWNIGFNVSANSNEITALDRSEDGILTGGISGGVGNNVQLLLEGNSVNSFYLFQQKYDNNGNALADGVDHNEDGTIDNLDIYEDLNGDGIVNDDDKRIIEDPAADLMFGLTTSFNYKGFDLGMTWRASLGNYVYNNTASRYGFLNHVAIREGYVNNAHTSVLETRFQDPQFFSDYYLEDASFVRLDNVTLGYRLPNFSNGLGARIYVTAQNLLTLTEYTGFDPEVDNGIDNAAYPRPRTFIFGVNLDL